MKNKTIKNTTLSLLILSITMLICEVLFYLDVGHQNINIVMSLAVFIIAAVTDG